MSSDVATTGRRPRWRRWRWAVGAFVVLGAIAAFAVVATQSSDDAPDATVGTSPPPDDVVLDVSGSGMTGGFDVVEVRADGTATIPDPREDIGSSSGRRSELTGRLTPEQVDELRDAALAAGLGARRLELDDPVRGMYVADAGTITITIDLGAAVRQHRVYGLGAYGERDGIEDRPPDAPGAGDPVKVAGRLAVLDFLNQVRAEVLAAVGAGGSGPTTPDEARLRTALESIGFRTVRAEPPGARGATVWVVHDSTLRIRSAPVGDLPYPASDLTERTIAGISVTTVEDRTRYAPARDLFVCGDLRYDVSFEPIGQVEPAGWGNVPFLTALIDALDCT